MPNVSACLRFNNNIHHTFIRSSCCLLEPSFQLLKEIMGSKYQSHDSCFIRKLKFFSQVNVRSPAQCSSTESQVWQIRQFCSLRRAGSRRRIDTGNGFPDTDFLIHNVLQQPAIELCGMGGWGGGECRPLFGQILHANTLTYQRYDPPFLLPLLDRMYSWNQTNSSNLLPCKNGTCRNLNFQIEKSLCTCMPTHIC